LLLQARHHDFAHQSWGSLPTWQASSFGRQPIQCEDDEPARVPDDGRNFCCRLQSPSAADHDRLAVRHIQQQDRAADRVTIRRRESFADETSTSQPNRDSPIRRLA
jgi:hypothetical protein